MDSITVARSMRGSLGMLAMNWLLAPTTQKKAEEAGMGAGLRAYAVGRLGVGLLKGNQHTARGWSHTNTPCTHGHNT